MSDAQPQAPCSALPPIQVVVAHPDGSVGVAIVPPFHWWVVTLHGGLFLGGVN